MKTGDNVIVVTIGNEARYGTKIYDATVKSVGRKWFKVEIPDMPWMGERHRFSLENFMNDGKEYISNYMVYKSIEEYEQIKTTPKLKQEILNTISKFNYEKLQKALTVLKEIDG